MKKYLAILVLAIFAAPILAQEDSSGGVAPDSFLYGLDVALDDIRYLMTFENSQKVKVGLEIADERLQEVKQMILKNKIEDSKKAEKEHEKMLNQVRQNADEIKKGKSGDDVLALAEAETKIEEHEKKIVTVENELKIEIKTKGTVTAEQQAVIDGVLEAIKNQTGEVKIKVNADKDELKISIRTESEDDDDETSEDDDEADDDKKDKDKEKGNTAERAADRIEDAMERVARAKALAALAGNSTSVPGDVTDLIRNAEKHLAKAKEAFEDGKYGEAFGQATAAENNAKNAIKILEGTVTPPPPAPTAAVIHGVKFEDKDGDGTRDDNEPGLANWTITLSGAANATTTTGTGGSYEFSNLAPGNYTVAETVKAGWVVTTINPVSVSAAANSSTVVNFGNFQLGTISGAKFDDLDGDGTKDANESVLANWTIQLSGTMNATTTTDANGAYTFANLGAGMYTLSEVVQSGWVQTEAPSVVAIQSGTNSQNNDFGNFRLGQITVLVYNDENNNTVKDGNETGLAGWTVNLAGTSNASATTDANGMATFSGLASGTYTVTQTVQANWTQTTSNPAAITVMSGTSASASFGNLQ